MKKIFALTFILAALTGLALGNAPAFIVGLIGFFFCQADLRQVSFHSRNHAYLQIVPGKFVVTDPASGRLQEVPYMSRAEKALFDQLITLGRSNAVTAQAISAGAISFDPVSYFIRADVTGFSGRQKIVSASTQYEEGVTNFPNGAALPQYYNFCFDRIAVRYASTNSANASPAAITGWSSVRASMPAALGNGLLIVKSNRNEIVETPVSDFTSVAAITGGGERDYDGGVLEKPRFFLELLQIEVELSFAAGQSMPSNANNTFAVEIMFYGVQARLKY